VSDPDRDVLDVLLILRASANQYPATRYQANLLAARGLRVGLVDLDSGPTPNELDPAVRRWRPHVAWNPKAAPRPAWWRRWGRWLRFRAACRGAMARYRPAAVIAYDTLGAVFAPPDPGHRRTVYHFHELPEVLPGAGFGPCLALKRTREWSRRADLVVFSDAGRARWFAREVGLQRPPKVVMNCPMRLLRPPESNLRPTLTGMGLGPGPVVCYLGTVGVNQALPETARSMGLWPPDALFVLIGPASDETRRAILAAGAAAGAVSRIAFLGPRPHAEALALAAGADVGLSLIQPNTRNLMFTAGAVNKRFEYMALDLPQVADAGPGVRELIEGNGVGLCADPRSPHDIGRAVSALTQDAETRRRMAEQARRLHLETLNYETQFAEVADWVLAACRRGHEPDGEGQGV
jgi:glycosyltransferase involved in cell wall biosynthesis